MRVCAHDSSNKHIETVCLTHFAHRDFDDFRSRRIEHDLRMFHLLARLDKKVHIIAVVWGTRCVVD
ncbi:hypothetical protein MNBD_PLANCTO03-2243 [hydrothermal vent metagenome]|uniref:Uncharacterized protein n=1 Tax=hydrothermal vent metagenome TaxID=652676 RepID=A0A3B1DUI2_9ZZZZ